MSPEATTNQQIDHRSDLFSLGVILYLMCSGSMPFSGSEPKEIVKKIRAGHYQPLQELLPIPERLALLVKSLLSSNPDARPQRGQDVVIELTEIVRENAIESSPANIARFLSQLFPEQHDKPIAKGELTELNSMVAKEKSPVSMTPSTSSRGLAPVDVSQTYRRSTGQFALTQDVADAPRGHEFPHPTRSAQQTIVQIPESRMIPAPPRRSRVKVLSFILVITALLAVASYLVRYT
jgi:serine/threonine protein kinase